MKKRILALSLAGIMTLSGCISIMAAETESDEEISWDYLFMDEDYIENGAWYTSWDLYDFCLPSSDWTFDVNAELSDEVDNNIYLDAVNEDGSEDFTIFCYDETDFTSLQDVLDTLGDSCSSTAIITLNGVECVLYVCDASDSDEGEIGLVFLNDASPAVVEVRTTCYDSEIIDDWENDASNIIYSFAPAGYYDTDEE